MSWLGAVLQPTDAGHGPVRSSSAAEAPREGSLSVVKLNWALRGPPNAGGVSPGILRIGCRGYRPSLLVDESGSDGLHANYLA